MIYYDEQLKNLAVQMDRKNKLTAALQELYGRQRSLKETVSTLDACRKKEAADIKVLEGSSFAAFFYRVAGKLDGKPDREQAEAYAAAVKYDVAAHELGTVECDIRQLEEELQGLRGCKERYDRALGEKRELIRQLDVPAAAFLLQIEESIVHLKSRKKELEEAILAGQDALYMIEDILESLDDAEGWETLDLVSGSFLFDIVKHEIPEACQEMLEELQVQLGKFRTELANVDIRADMQIKVDGFVRFADYFLDSLLIDWTVLDTISESKKQAEDTKKQIEDVLAELESMRSAVIGQQKEEKRKMETLI